ncbi:hypothetical protein [Thermomonas fusca]
MKFFNKQALAFAIVGALASGNALAAQAAIQTTSTTYAKEIVLPKVFTVPVTWTTGYNFSGDEVRYACLKLDGGTFATAPSVAVYDAVTAGTRVDQIGGTGDVNIGSVNTNGSVMFFSLTSTQAAAEQIQDDYAIVLSGGGVNITSYNTNLTATVGLYDNPSNAAACGSAGLIAPSYDQEPLISFKPSFAFKIDPNKATASVDNVTTSFAGFKFPVDGVSSSADEARLAYAELVQINTTNLRADGNLISLSDIFPNTATLTVEGDFGDWLTSTSFDGTNAAGANLTATAAKWTVNPQNLNGDFYVYADETSDEEITPGIYTAKLAVTPNAGYTLTGDTTKPAVLIPTVDEAASAVADNAVDDGNAIAGQIVQDGVRLQAPLVQVPGGWLSRLVITNTGNKDRTFFLTVQGEDGTTITTGNLTGYTVKAKKTYVIEDMNSVLQGFNAGAKTRATVIATVAGPEKEIKGLYQIVNTTNMSLSNYVMVNQDSGGH